MLLAITIKLERDGSKNHAHFNFEKNSIENLFHKFISIKL